MSEPFVVFSAKKFPGMIESTDLSKAFAHQGIRIPVRHAGADNANGKANQAGHPHENRRKRSEDSEDGEDEDDNDDE
jgi:Velvet factor